MGIYSKRYSSDAVVVTTTGRLRATTNREMGCGASTQPAEPENAGGSQPQFTKPVDSAKQPAEDAAPRATEEQPGDDPKLDGAGSSPAPAKDPVAPVTKPVGEPIASESANAAAASDATKTSSTCSKPKLKRVSSTVTCALRLGQSAEEIVKELSPEQRATIAAALQNDGVVLAKSELSKELQEFQVTGPADRALDALSCYL